MSNWREIGQYVDADIARGNKKVAKYNESSQELVNTTTSALALYDRHKENKAEFDDLSGYAKEQGLEYNKATKSFSGPISSESKDRFKIAPAQLSAFRDANLYSKDPIDLSDFVLDDSGKLQEGFKISDADKAKMDKAHSKASFANFKKKMPKISDIGFKDYMKSVGGTLLNKLDAKPNQRAPQHQSVPFNYEKYGPETDYVGKPSPATSPKPTENRGQNSDWTFGNYMKAVTGTVLNKIDAEPVKRPKAIKTLFNYEKYGPEVDYKGKPTPAISPEPKKYRGQNSNWEFGDYMKAVGGTLLNRIDTDPVERIEPMTVPFNYEKYGPKPYWPVNKKDDKLGG